MSLDLLEELSLGGNGLAESGLEIGLSSGIAAGTCKSGASEGLFESPVLACGVQ